MIRKIGIISDTHIPPYTGVAEEIWDHFADVELVIHAGDLSMSMVIDLLETIAPVIAVQGNVERPDVVDKLPIKREIAVGPCRIGIVHILGEKADYAKNARLEFPTAHVVVFGHSHEPYVKQHDGQLLFNPGSANDRRRQPVCSVGLLTIDDETGKLHGQIIPLPSVKDEP